MQTHGHVFTFMIEKCSGYLIPYGFDLLHCIKKQSLCSLPTKKSRYEGHS